MVARLARDGSVRLHDDEQQGCRNSTRPHTDESGSNKQPKEKRGGPLRGVAGCNRVISGRDVGLWDMEMRWVLLGQAEDDDDDDDGGMRPERRQNTAKPAEMDDLDVWSVGCCGGRILTRDCYSRTIRYFECRGDESPCSTLPQLEYLLLRGVTRTQEGEELLLPAAEIPVLGQTLSKHLPSPLSRHVSRATLGQQGDGKTAS